MLAILELLKVHQRVLYIDIDIHHGDGVEEAFYTTDRVMTVSFHKFGEYFPAPDTSRTWASTASTTRSTSRSRTASTTSHVALFAGDGEGHGDVSAGCGGVPVRCGFPHRRQARVLQPLHRGHGECLKYMQTFNVPLLVLGGGGHHPQRRRCWTYETGCLSATTSTTSFR